ncbi:MAG: hypothetical protein ABI685_05545 [Ferruginibacter sp.]
MGHGFMAVMAIFAILSFFICLFFLVKAIRRKNKGAIIVSATAILLTVILSLKIDLKNVKDLFSKELSRLKPRSKNEMYTIIFKLPVDSCVTVINTVDQVVPKIDCCAWLEFKTCPAALQKMINRLPYQVAKYAAGDSIMYNPSSNQRPFWWQPATLGDSLIKLNYVFDALTERTLLFNKDSTHVYCCDRAE